MAIGRRFDISVFHGIVMTIVEMSGVILFITDQVLPETALPDSPFPFRGTARIALFVSRKTTGKPGFDQSPAGGEFRIVFRQRPDSVEMIG